METEPQKKQTNKLLLSLQKTYQRFLKIRGNPREIALGFALGIFIGMSPTMGAQTLIVVPLAALLKWNKISAAVGVWISNPVTAPIIYSITFFIGTHLTGIKESLNPAEGVDFSIITMLLTAPRILWALILGGIIIGLPTSIIGYYLSFTAVSQYQKGITKQIIKRKERLVVKRRNRKSRKRKKKRKK